MVLPLLPPGIDTLAPFGSRAAGVTRLADRRNRLHLLAFPRGRSRSAFGRRGRLVSRASAGGWQLAIRAPRKTRFNLQAALSVLKQPLRPCAVSLGERKLKRSRWTYNKRSAVLRVKFRARRATLDVSSRC